MKLYHGTSARFLPKILKNGIQPRRITKKSQWKHSVESNEDAVYLTDAYAAYFAINACNKNYPIAAVIEIDSAKLDIFDLVPDEDVLEQSGRNGRDDLDPDWTMEQRTKYYRDNIWNWANGESWEKSLKALGTCAHLGHIPAEAITRVATFDTSDKKLLGLSMTFMDPSISLMNYQFVGNKYRYYTAWLFGEEESSTDKPHIRFEGELPPNWHEDMRWDYPPSLRIDRDLITIQVL